MLTTEEELELERQADDMSQGLLLLLFLGRKNISSNRSVEFDRRKGVFRIDGKVVSVTTIRIFLAQIEKIGAKRLAEHLADFQAGRITRAEWERRTATTIKISHLLAAALALGGIDQAEDSPELEKKTEEERQYLLGFSRDIKAGRLSNAKMAARAKSYMLAVAVTYWTLDQLEKERLQTVKRVKKIIGGTPIDKIEIDKLYKEARRYRRASESCGGCLEYSGYWMPIKDMPPIGSLDCASRCRCFIVYR